MTGHKASRYGHLPPPCHGWRFVSIVGGQLCSCVGDVRVVITGNNLFPELLNHVNRAFSRDLVALPCSGNFS
ncbi:MAG: hypothetical protein GX216_00670 [Methanomicrobiales archaeon]|nr:hypothetical protein [Methanomicrobiales archaeon]